MSIPQITHSSPLSYGSGPNDTDETVGAPLPPLAKFAILIGASIVAGSMALYFGSVGIRKTRYAISAGLIADLAGIVAAIFVAYLFFH